MLYLNYIALEKSQASFEDALYFCQYFIRVCPNEDRLALMYGEMLEVL